MYLRHGWLPGESMQRIVCRFDDSSSFLDHIAQPAFTTCEHRGLHFIREDALATDQVVRVTIVIEDARESHDLHMRLDESMPSIAGSGRGVVWRYRATPVPEDAPWLEMLATKHATAHRMAR